eukprot:TRINITY_DN65293_c0_g1_i1.p1 TRINITY_DN65293_c0_g1~~TRINITY_DN65293_c0_g1_i1.p1  ORF type:complete len:569 (-),score=88.56 TRINITY_DN65293_c0_g1_i1:99-1805(-)
MTGRSLVIDAFVLLVLCLLLCHTARAQGSHSHPCTDDCLAEALTGNPTKGCAAGTYWVPHPPNLPAESCQPCPMGAYCPGVAYGDFTGHPVNLNRRILCPAGHYNVVEGASSVDECLECDPGRYNTYIGSTECTDCPAGKYSITAGSSKTQDCLACPAGHYCGESCARPVPCNAGLYVSFEGMKDSSACLECTIGHYCPVGTVHPLDCPAGSFGNKTGIIGKGFHPDAFLPDDWTDIRGTGVDGTGCSSCPAAFFCTTGSVVPMQCPAGTYSGIESEAESDCADCPEGMECSMATSSDYLQADVRRNSWGTTMGGVETPVSCPVDETVLHHSFPDITGCVEHCPYQFPRQSYCHMAGDGRVPDRTSDALSVASLVLERGQYGLRSEVQREEALSNLSILLSSMSPEESLKSLTMPDSNGRTPMLMAAMMGDVELLDLLWQHGVGNDAAASAVRDSGGFTALMHALLLDRTDAVSWLVAKNASLTSADMDILRDRGVELGGIENLTVDAQLEMPAAYLGRGSWTWNHPSAVDFGGLPVSSPMGTTTTTPKFALTTSTTTSQSVTTESDT